MYVVRRKISASRQLLSQVSARGTTAGVFGATRKLVGYIRTGWWRGTVVERRSLAGELSLSCARPAADR